MLICAHAAFDLTAMPSSIGIRNARGSPGIPMIVEIIQTEG